MRKFFNRSPAPPPPEPAEYGLHTDEDYKKMQRHVTKW